MYLRCLMAVLTAVFLSAGCAEKRGPSVKGQVLLDGKPVAEASVVFEGGKATVTDQEGKFSFDGSTFNTLKPGKYAVSISLYVDQTGKVPDREEFGQLQAAGLLKSVLPARYGSIGGDNPLTAEIKDGPNDLPPFQLTSK